ncbi:MAG: RNA 2',3'-cyclic phosphodiesterase [Candidatus Sigynarchaeota archaeon]
MEDANEIRAFIAMEIKDSSIVSKARDIQALFLDDAMGKLKFVELENMHVTLKFLGNITIPTAKKVYQILQGLGTIPAGGFDITLRRVGQFGGRVLWVGIEDPAGIIAKTAARVDEELSKQLGIPREKRPFEGHMTLARVKFLNNRKLFQDKVARVKDVELGKQHIDAVLLKQSRLTPRGPIYTTLAY